MSITKYKSGSFMELLAVSFPLMVTAFSVTFMFFIDRLFLSWYSLEAHNAAVTSANYGWAFTMSGISLTGIAEVFVAQNNGAKRFNRIGSCVWQMVWFSLATIPLFMLIAFFGSSYLFSSPLDQMERDYFFYTILFCPSQLLFGALASFWIGRGKSGVVTLVSCLGNGVNIALDYLLIFGWEGWVPSLGAKGAAIATSIGSVVQALILYALFIRGSNRVRFGTGNFNFDWPLLRKSLSVGFPVFLSIFFEVLGWAVFYGLMKSAGDNHLTVVAVSQSLLMANWFVVEGVQKGAMTVAGNGIGARQPEVVNRTTMQGIKILGLVSLLLIVMIYFFPIAIPSIFLEDSYMLENPEMAKAIQFGILCYCVYYFFEGIRILLGGVLASAGDTFFSMIVGASSIWIFLIPPVYLLINCMGGSIYLAVTMMVLYSIIPMGVLALRLAEGKWRSIDLLQVKL